MADEQKYPTFPHDEDEVEETETVALLNDSSETIVTFDTETGEVLGVVDAPDDATDINDTVEWIGARRAYAVAKAQGLTAERDVLLAKINEQYNPKIKRLERFADWMVLTYYNRLKEFAARALTGQKTKTLKIAMLTMKFGKTRASTQILEGMEEVALQHVKMLVPDAIKVSESILKTELRNAVAQAEGIMDMTEAERKALKLPKGDLLVIKARADRAALLEHGINLYEGGEETFKVE